MSVLCLPTVARASCQDARQDALREQQEDPSDTLQYVPTCRPDGSFAREQCFIDFEYCWCVSSDGRPIHDTTVQGSTAHCTHTTGEYTQQLPKHDTSPPN